MAKKSKKPVGPKPDREGSVLRAQDIFVAEFLVHRNATRAYLASHSEAKYSTAKTEGNRLLTNPDIQKKISEADRARIERTNVDQDKIIRALAEVAFATEEDLQRARFSGERIKTTNRVKALEVLLKHVKEENGRAGGSKPVSWADLMKAAMERKKAAGNGA